MLSLRALTAKDKPALELISVPIFGDAVNLEGGEFFIGLGAFEGESLSGFVTGQSVFEQAEIYYVAVLPKAQRQGVGAFLLDGFFVACRERLAEVVFLEVRASNQAAIDFYGQAGFLPCGVRKNYYDDGENAVLMRRNL